MYLDGSSNDKYETILNMIKTPKIELEIFMSDVAIRYVL